MCTGALTPLARQDAGQLFGQAHALDLGEIRRVFDDAVTNDAGNGDADRIDVALADYGQDFACEDFHEFAHGESVSASTSSVSWG